MDEILNYQKVYFLTLDCLCINSEYVLRMSIACLEAEI